MAGGRRGCGATHPADDGVVRCQVRLAVVAAENAVRVEVRVVCEAHGEANDLDGAICGQRSDTQGKPPARMLLCDAGQCRLRGTCSRSSSTAHRVARGLGVNEGCRTSRLLQRPRTSCTGNDSEPRDARCLNGALNGGGRRPGGCCSLVGARDCGADQGGSGLQEGRFETDRGRGHNRRQV